MFIYIVVNESVVVFVGEPVTVREDVRVIINCSKLIDDVIANGIINPNVNWFKAGYPLSNGSAVNVLISADKRLSIITDSLLAVGGQLGNDGDYTCEVCAPNSSSCRNMTTSHVVCGE